MTLQKWQPTLKIVSPLLVILFAIVFVEFGDQQPRSQAQSGNAAQCDALVQEALQQIANACIDIGRNEICYGNDQVSATLNDDTLFFEAPGDIIPVTALDTIITRPADPETGEWGVALMDIQADLPAASDGSMRIVLLGGVEIAPARPAATDDLPTCDFTNTASANLNLRAGPGTNFRVVDILDRRDTVPVYGVDSTGEWVRSARGWVYAPFGTLACAAAELTVMENAQDAYVAPMQSFTLQVDEQANCQTTPAGLLIQSPTGQTANIMVNNVELRIGSTAFVTMRDSNENLVVANFSGNVAATANGATARIPTGAQSAIPIEDNEPAGPPSRLATIDESILSLDEQIIDQLPETVERPAPITFPADADGSTGPGTGDIRGTPPGQWLGCGSCNTCGHPANECVTSPDGLCLWDPATCTRPPSGGTPSGTGTPGPYLTVPQSFYTCVMGSPLTVTATYTSFDGAILSSASANSSSSEVVVNSTPITSPTTFDIKMDCLFPGTSTITADALDTSDRNVSTSFTVQVN